MLLRTTAAAVLAGLAVSALQELSAHPVGPEDGSEEVLYDTRRLGVDQWRFGVDVESLRSPIHPPIPHRPRPNHPSVDNKTIYQVLQGEPRFSRVFKLVNFTEEITNLLNDSSANVTFFAPPDFALRLPKHPRHRHPKHAHMKESSIHRHQQDSAGCSSVDDELTRFDEDVHCTLAHASLNNSPTLFSAIESFLQDDYGPSENGSPLAQHDIAEFVRRALLYHILPTNEHAVQLARNTTYKTNLALGYALDGEALRIQVSSLPGIIKPRLSINRHANVLVSDIKTLNGVVHVINHPLLLPPSVYEILFAAPTRFSVLTSALGRVGLIDAIDLRHIPGSEDTEGSPAVTFFAPTNDAFGRLPKSLQRFLFSGHGERVLKKLLELHTVPEFILHSDWIHNASDGAGAANAFVVDDDARGLDEDNIFDPFENDCTYRLPPLTPPLSSPAHVPHLPRPQLVYALNITAPTLLTNVSLSVRIAQFKRLILPHAVVTKLAVNGQLVVASDVVASNGALHVVDRLLHPFREHKHRDPPRKLGHSTDNGADLNAEEEQQDEDVWENWEEWLPAWADEE